MSGTSRTAGARRGLFSTRMKPSRSAPASTATSTSSWRVSPHTFTSGRESSSRSFAGGSGALHQRRADEDRVRARELGGGALRAACGCRSRRSRRRVSRAARATGPSCCLRSMRNVERSRALTPTIGAWRAIALSQLIRVVGLDERVQAELVRAARAGARVVASSRSRRISSTASAPGVAQLERDAPRSRRSPSRAAVYQSPRERRPDRRSCRRSARRRARRSPPPRPLRSRATISSMRAPGRMSPADGERRLNSAIAESPGAASASWKRPIRLRPPA